MSANPGFADKAKTLVTAQAAQRGLTVGFIEGADGSVYVGKVSPASDVVHAADVAPSVLGHWIGEAVQLVLMDHSEDEYPDPNVHELAHRVLALHSASSLGS